MASRMPVLGCNHRIGLADHLVYWANHPVPVCNRQLAARAEIILHIDHQKKLLPPLLNQHHSS